MKLKKAREGILNLLRNFVFYYPSSLGSCLADTLTNSKPQSLKTQQSDLELEQSLILWSLHSFCVMLCNY